MTDLADRRLLVAGGTGLLGRHVVARLEAAGGNVFVPRIDLVRADPSIRTVMR